MAETTYYRNKVYIPRAVRESLGLVDGDKLYIKVLDKGVAQLILIRGSEAGKKILEKINNPTNLGKLRERITRKDIYENIT